MMMVVNIQHRMIVNNFIFAAYIAEGIYKELVALKIDDKMLYFKCYSILCNIFLDYGQRSWSKEL